MHREQWLRKHWQSGIGNTSSLNLKIAEEQKLLELAVFQLYNLSYQEILLVEDALQYNIKPTLTKKLRINNALTKAKTDDLQHYASRMCTQLDDILNYGDLELTSTIIEFDFPSPLLACRFVQSPIGRDKKMKNIRLNDIDDIINQMSQDLRTEIADKMYVQRNLRVYTDDGFWIIKGNQKRLWSETAALNDADAVVKEHMEMMVER